MPDPPIQPLEGVRVDPLIGRTLAKKYRLDKLLGEGGMGAVYRARQIALEKTIAVKVMHPELAADPMFAARFHREAKAASQLDHANSISILDFGEEPDGVLYIAMEFLDGRDLLAIVEQEAPLSSARIVDLLSQALSALAVAHELGIIHRDLKPENIMVLNRRGEDDRTHEVVKVCDFGIAKVEGSIDAADAAPPTRAKKGKLTTAGLVIGTPEYMSPEQGRGEALDARCDLYSMGVILYLLLSGQTPFDAPTPLGIVLKHQTEVPVPPSRIRNMADLALEVVCLKAMSKRPADRYGSAREMRAALRGALGGVSDSRITPTGPVYGAGPPTEVSVPLQTQVVPAGLPRASAIAETAAFVATGPLGTPTDGASGPLAVGSHTTDAGTAARATSRALPSSRLGVTIAAIVVGVGVLGGAALLGRSWLVAGPSTSPAPRATTAPPPAPVPHAAKGSDEPHADPPVTPAPKPEALIPAPVNQPPSLKREKSQPLGAAQASPAHGALGAAVGDTPRPTPPPVEAPPPPAPPPADRPAPPQAAPPDPPAAPARAFDPAAAHVSEGSVAVLTGGVNPRAVNGAVNMGKINACYRGGATDGSPEGTWTLHLGTDDEGNVIEGKLDGPLSDSIKGCISRALLRNTIKADTGAVTANIPLTFRLR